MSRRRYVYSYSPRRNSVRQGTRGPGWYAALWFAAATALILVVVWVAAGGLNFGGSSTPESGVTVMTAVRPPVGAETGRPQGGTASLNGKGSKPPAITALAAAVI